MCLLRKSRQVCECVNVRMYECVEVCLRFTQHVARCIAHFSSLCARTPAWNYVLCDLALYTILDVSQVRSARDALHCTNFKFCMPVHLLWNFM
jgi:hypothetical protein